MTDLSGAAGPVVSEADALGPVVSEDDAFGPPLSDADVGITPAYLAAPRASNPTPSTFGGLFTHPLTTLGNLFDRDKAEAAEGFQHSSVAGAATGAASDAVSQALDIERLKNLGSTPAQAAAQAKVDAQERVENERAAAPRPAGSLLETITDFPAQVAGSMLSPESFVAAPVKGLEIAGKPIVSGILRHVLGGAATNALVNPAVQGAQIARGYQPGFNVKEALEAPVIGAVAGAGIGGAEAAGHAATKAAADAAAKKAATAPLTADTLWSRLLSQESGGKQVGPDGKPLTSAKGAVGAAQLEPETAQQVANQIGQPGLAKIAMGTDDSAAVANQILGKVYLDQQFQTFGGDPVLALAAYNAGPARVQSWIRTYGDPGSVGAARWLAMVPFKETRDYVHNILGDRVGEPHTLTPEDMAYMRGRMPEFPTEPEVPPPPLKGEEEAAPAEEEDEPFPPLHPEESPPAAGQEQVPEPEEEDPFPKAGSGQGSASSGPPADRPRDLTDEALDQMRSGKPVKMGEGPSLLEALAKAGGVKDQGGELSNILGGAGENRLLKMVRRAGDSEKGKTLQEAAEWAQDEGYIGDQAHNDQAEAYGGRQVASTQELLDAIEREVAGEKIYPADRINERARALQEHMEDLDEMMAHAGVDTSTHTNEEIRAALDRFFQGAGEHTGSMADTGEVLGMAPKAAMATGAEAVQQAQARARMAALRVASRNNIMGAARRGGLVGERRVGAVPAPIGPDGLPDLSGPPIRGEQEILQRLEKALSYPVRQGRISLRNAAGTFNRLSGMVRSKGRFDLDVIAHEFGHALEFKDGYRLPHVLAAMKAHEPVLKAMDYDPVAARRHEGFAEWLRLYVTNPEFLKRSEGATAFTQDFEKAMAQDNPKALDALQEAQADYQAFHEASSVDVARSAVMEPIEHNPLARLVEGVKNSGPWGLMRDAVKEAYRGAVSSLNPWREATDAILDDIEARTGVRPELMALQDPEKVLAAIPHAATMGHFDLTEGVHIKGVKKSPAFSDALTLALGKAPFGWSKKSIRDFGAYMVARRAVHLYDAANKGVWVDANGMRHGMEGPPDKLSKASWQQTIDNFEQKHPQWGAAASMIYQYLDALWLKRLEEGFITPAQYAAGLMDHPDYVPMFRDVRDKGFKSGGRGSSTEYAGGVLRIKGSDRLYINPLYSIMDMTHELNRRAVINQGVGALRALAENYGAMGGHIAEVINPRKLEATPTSVAEVIANAARKYAVTARDAESIIDSVRNSFGAQLDDDMATSVWRARTTGPNGEPWVWHWKDGERTPIQLPDGDWGVHMIEAISNMEAPMRAWWISLASIPAKMNRAGIIADPAYFFTNAFKDQFNNLVASDHFIPVVTTAQGIAQEAAVHLGKADHTTKLYSAVGGESGGYMSEHAHETSRRSLQHLRQGLSTVRYFGSWNGMARVAEMSETGSRRGVFTNAFNAAKKQGMSDWEAAWEARHESSDMLPFSRRGAWPAVRVAMQIIPFMNASIQAVDKMRRVAAPGTALFPDGFRSLMGGRPLTPEESKQVARAAKMWAVASALGIGGLVNEWANKDDPEWHKLNDMYRNTAWPVRVSPTEFFVGPKPQELGSISTAIERGYEAIHDHDPTAWKRFMEGMSQIFVPPLDVTAVQPLLDIQRNRDALGTQIVPDNLKGSEPRDQYTNRTSELAKWIGAHAPGKGVSPAVIDYLMREWGGTNVRNALDASLQHAPTGRSAADTWILKRFVKDWTRGDNASRDFYNLVASDGSWAQGVASVRGIVTANKPEAEKYAEAAARLQSYDPAQRAYIMASLFNSGNRHVKQGDEGQFMAQDHPMIRAQESSSVYRGLASDLAEGNVMGPDNKVVSVTPDQRRDAIHVLRALAVADVNNAMLVAGVPGYANQPPLPEARYIQELRSIAPELIPPLAARLSKVQNIVLTAQNWARDQAHVEAPMSAAALKPYFDAKAMPTTKKGLPTAVAKERALQTVVPAQ